MTFTLSRRLTEKKRNIRKLSGRNLSYCRRLHTNRTINSVPVAAGSVFLRSPPALLPPLMTSRGDWMPRKSRASSLRNWIHVKRTTQPWFSSHSSSRRRHRELIWRRNTREMNGTDSNLKINVMQNYVRLTKDIILLTCALVIHLELRVKTGEEVDGYSAGSSKLSTRGGKKQTSYSVCFSPATHRRNNR